ncbi:hypothetical protein Tco_1193619 [Tanacetum coccineum]
MPCHLSCPSSSLILASSVIYPFRQELLLFESTQPFSDSVHIVENVLIAPSGDSDRGVVNVVVVVSDKSGLLLCVCWLGRIKILSVFIRRSRRSLLAPPGEYLEELLEGVFGDCFWVGVARSAVNAANRAKNTIPTHQGKKSFAQGRNEYKVEHGHYEDLIETWRKTHSEPKSGRWKSKENKQRYLQMKAMQDQVRGGVIPFMTDQQILDQVVPSENRQNMSGMGRKLPGSGSTSRKHPNKVFADVLTRDEMTQILRQKEQENELLRKQVEEAQQRAYLASLKADASSQWSTAAYQNTQTLYGTLGTFFGHYNSPNYARPFSPHDFNLVPPPPPGPSMPHAPEWAHLLQPPFPTNQPLRPLQPPYPGPFPQPPYPGSFPQPSYNEPFPIPPVNNNTFNNCYHPVYNSTQGIASSSNDPAQRSFYNLVMNPHMTDSRTLDELARDNSLANNDEGASGEEEEEEEGNEGTNDGDYSEENEEEEEGTDGNEE